MEIFVEISALLAIATVIGIIMRALRQPLIIGHIITGLIVGPALLGLVSNKETLEVFASFGIALLLFIVGLGLNPKIVKEVGKVSIITGVGQVIFTTLIGFALVYALGFDTVTSFYVAIALTFSSTIIVLKLLTDKKDQNKLYGKIAIGFLLVQDIIATFALLVASASGTDGFSWENISMLIAKGILVISAMYLVVKLIITRLTNFISKSQELLFLFALSWGFGIAAITYLGGFSLEVGALFAGVALASMPYAQEVASRLKPLRDFFIIVFFIALGATLNLSDVSTIIWQAIGLSLFVLVGNPLIVMLLMGILGYTKKTSFKAGLTVAQISEFSIIFILLGEKNGQVTNEAVSLVTMVGIITIAASTYMIIYSNQLYQFLADRLPIFRDKSNRRESEHRSNYSAILFGYQRGGHEFIQVFKDLKKRYIVVDYDPDAIETLERNNIPHLYGDAQDSDLLDEIRLDGAKIIVSTITEFDTNIFLIQWLENNNPNCVSIVHADSINQAEELYAFGASYVMLPHYIGSERMGQFIRKSGLDKEEFRKMKDKHLDRLKNQLLQ